MRLNLHTRTLFIILLVIGAAVLFTLDRVEHYLESQRIERNTAMWADDAAQLLQAFFQNRITAMQALARLNEKTPPATTQTVFPQDAEALLRDIYGAEAAFLLDDDLQAKGAWVSRSEILTGATLAQYREVLAPLIERVRRTGQATVSPVVNVAQTDRGVLIVTPTQGKEREPLYSVGLFGFWDIARRRLNLGGSRFHGAIAITGPEGQRVPSSDSGLESAARVVALPVTDRIFQLEIEPPRPASASSRVARTAIWGLGLVLLLSFTLFYFALLKQSNKLRRTNLDLEAHARGTDEMNARLLRLNRELDDFAYTVAHDLKEPIRGIEGLTRLFMKEYGHQLDDKARDYLMFVKDSGKRMRQLVEDLLRLSRSGRRHYPREQVNMNELVAEVLASLQYAIREKEADVAIESDLPATVCDPVRISEVFQNLVTNALKFSNARRPEVRIGHERKNGASLFWVRDNGDGVPPEKREAIFRPFQRGESDSDLEGSGVGLAICKRVVEHHGGRIWAQDDHGRGAKFCFTLPAEPPPVREAGNRNPETAGA